MEEGPRSAKNPNKAVTGREEKENKAKLDDNSHQVADFSNTFMYIHDVTLLLLPYQPTIRAGVLKK